MNGAPFMKSVDELLDDGRHFARLSTAFWRAYRYCPFYSDIVLTSLLSRVSQSRRVHGDVREWVPTSNKLIDERGVEGSANGKSARVAASRPKPSKTTAAA